MEAEGYAVGSVVLGAHSAGADHQRQRLYWVADAQPYGRKPQPVRVPDGIQHEAIEQKKCALPIGGCGASESCRMGDTEGERPQGRTGDGRGLAQEGQREPAERHARMSGVSRNFWSDAIPHLCKDGKLRRFEPRVFPLVAKLPRGMVPSSRIGFPIDADQTGEARAMRLKGYGNAICVDTAVMFIEECENIFCDANPTMKGAQK